MKLVMEILALLWQAARQLLTKWFGRYVRAAIAFALIAIGLLLLAVLLLLRTC